MRVNANNREKRLKLIAAMLAYERGNGVFMPAIETALNTKLPVYPEGSPLFGCVRQKLRD